jgi:2-polyprenyl-3-methyl-5-hydroxy-6-metoxy-1,4-benzoquinol methylase
MQKRYQIQFPSIAAHQLAQDEVYFNLVEDGETRRLRFHDYEEIYSRPGLYEQLFYDRLKCNSPFRVTEMLSRALTTVCEPMNELRVLDLGAGNGMMGEELKREGVARLVGADIISEAREAAYRDRPDIYDDYYVADLMNLGEKDAASLAGWQFDCLTCVAALGFGDIPPKAFFTAMKRIRTDGWLSFNIKETFLDPADQSGFSRLIRELIFSKYLHIHHLELYRHRLSMEGTQLFYYGMVGRLTASIPDGFLAQHDID